MKHEFVKQTGSRRLILIYAGWAMDAEPFRHVCRPGYDTMVVWDYRDLTMNWSGVSSYDEIALIAWSMGVYAASMTIHSIDHLITARIAVNGTLSPVDNMRGIPENIFEGTASTLDDRNLRKFFRRMCGDRPTTERFMQHAPSRPVGELVDELRAIYPEPWFCNPKVERWDRAVIGRQDAIFPPCNQQRAWQGTPVAVVDRPHYIDLQEIADAYIIDKERAADRFDTRRDSYDDNTPVQKAIVEALVNDIAQTGVYRQISAEGASCLEIGSGTGSLSRRLASLCSQGFLYLWDICPTPPDGLANFTSCDAELQICRTPPSRFDTIATASTIQWFNSPRRFLAECHRVLRPGGHIVLSAFVRGNMHQLSAAGASTLNMPDERQWRDMVPSGMTVVSWATADYDLAFDEPTDVLRHLRLSGVNGLDRTGHPAAGTAIVRHYPRSLDGRCHLTYRTIRMILKKPENG